LKSHKQSYVKSVIEHHFNPRFQWWACHGCRTFMSFDSGRAPASAQSTAPSSDVNVKADGRRFNVCRGLRPEKSGSTAAARAVRSFWRWIPSSMRSSEAWFHNPSAKQLRRCIRSETVFAQTFTSTAPKALILRTWAFFAATGLPLGTPRPRRSAQPIAECRRCR